MSQPLIELKNVNFSYHDEPALKDINLEVHAGEYLGVIGPNGGGKTTLLRLMLGLITPDDGTITLFGEPAAKFRDWTKIGYVPQRTSILDSKLPITVREVVSLGRVALAGPFRRLGHADHEAVTAAMKRVDVLPLADRLITELSGGQQQRVLIAKALAARPEVLILDEPTVGIDIKSQDTFYQILSDLSRNEGLTLIMVSHDIDVVFGEVTKLACINDTLIYHGTPREFVKDDYIAQLYGKDRKLILHGH